MRENNIDIDIPPRNKTQVLDLRNTALTKLPREIGRLSTILEVDTLQQYYKTANLAGVGSRRALSGAETGETSVIISTKGGDSGI